MTVWLVERVGGSRTERGIVLTAVLTAITRYRSTLSSSLQVDQKLLCVLLAVERLPVVHRRGPVIALSERMFPERDQLQEVWPCRRRSSVCQD